MKILHITPAFYMAHIYGGPIESVYKLCHYLVLNGCEVRVLTTDANGVDKVLDVDKGREIEIDKSLYVRYCRRIMRHSVSPTLTRLLPFYVHWADVVHLTAVYSFPTIPTLMTCMALGKPVVWSPRGALQRWERSSRGRVKKVWERICRAVAPRRLVLHVTSEEEAQESHERLPGVETVIIPNGIEIPEKVTLVCGKGMLRLLYLGRLHPKKGIENQLEACKILIGGSGMPWSLTIAGAGDPNYTRTIRTKIQDLGLSERVKMVGEVIGAAKQRLFENADITVMPSYTENFGMVVAEALAHGVPVIVSKGTPWRRVEEMGCGVWVENDPESLAKAIERMSGMPLGEMGQRGREWMEKEFSWNDRARDMMKLYETLQGKNRT
jgi:glycosyltransferase involved in cell wall biosynthesis